MKRTGLMGVLLLGALLAGCGGSSRATWIVRQPDWEFERYERLAVLPASVRDPNATLAAEQLTDVLTNLLAQNGQFTVVTRHELADIMREQDLSNLADVVDPSTAIPSGGIKGAQVLVSTTLAEFDVIDRVEEKLIRVPRVDRRGRMVGFDEVSVLEYQRGVVLAGGARVIDAETGVVLFAHTTPPIKVERARRGSPPRERVDDLVALAVHDMAQEIYMRVAPVRVRAKFKSDMLEVATDYYDGRYDTTRRLPVSASSFLVVVRELPSECDRNDFRVTITEKDGRVDLWGGGDEGRFTWSASAGSRGVSFSVPMARLTATGGREFVAKLYSVGDDEPAIVREFELDVPKREARAAAGTVELAGLR
jgi:hypothetical protein